MLLASVRISALTNGGMTDCGTSRGATKEMGKAGTCEPTTSGRSGAAGLRTWSIIPSCAAGENGPKLPGLMDSGSEISRDSYCRY